MADHGEGGESEWERMCINRWLVFWSDGQSGVDSAARSEDEKERLGPCSLRAVAVGTLGSRELYG